MLPKASPVRSACLLLLVLAAFPITAGSARADYPCSDVQAILETATAVNELNKKYCRYLDEQGRNSDHAFYEAYIFWENEGILRCVKAGDMALVKTFVDFVVSHENSADEGLSWNLAALYLDRQAEVVSLLPDYTPEQREHLARSVEWGLLNIHWDKETRATDEERVARELAPLLQEIERLNQ